MDHTYTIYATIAAVLFVFSFLAAISVMISTAKSVSNPLFMTCAKLNDSTDWKSVIENCSRLINQDPSYADTYYIRGRAYAQFAENNENYLFKAIKDFEYAQQLYKKQNDFVLAESASYSIEMIKSGDFNNISRLTYKF